MLAHLHVKNLALIEEIEVEFGPGLNILTGETGAGKSILLGSMQLILGAKTSKNMIRENASYALVELLFQVENEKALETLKALDICPEDGQVLLSRKIMDGRSINKINGETSTVGQMKAAAACLLDIHGQHEHQSLLYQDKQLAILDAYGKEKILPAKEKVSLAYKEYSKCKTELGSMNMNEEQRNRELAFLEFEIKEIEKANLQPGEDEELEARYRKMSNAKLIVDSLQLVHNLTGYESKEGAGETVGEALKEFSHVTQYDPELTPLAETLTSVDGLLNDFNRELSAYLDELTFDEGEFYETERRLDLINGLKAKYGRTIEEIFTYRKLQEEKLEKFIKQNDFSSKTALLCLCDSYAIDAMTYLQNKGMHVPEQVGIMGYDDVDQLKYIHPRITTIKYSVLRMGKIAIDMLFQNMEQKIDNQECLLEYEIVDGESL